VRKGVAWFAPGSLWSRAQDAILRARSLSLPEGAMIQAVSQEEPPPKDWARNGLLAAGLILRLALAWSPFAYLAERGPLIDDAFYSLSIARNIAGGAGPTADGVHVTSGFQPLYTILLTPGYFLFPHDPILPIHLALTLLALCGAVTGGFVFRIVRRVASRRAALFSLALWALSPYFLSQGENGLETGLFGLCLAAALDYHLGVVRPQLRSRNLIGLGFLLGITILARVDGVLFALAIAFDLGRLPSRPRDRLHHLALASGTALATVTPYLLFLFLRFGAILPESGTATRYLSLCYGTLFVFGPKSVRFFPPESVPWVFYLGSLRKAVQTLASQPLLFPFSPFLCLASLFGFFNPRSFLRVLGAAATLLANLCLLRLPYGTGNNARVGLVRVGAVCTALWIPAYVFGALGQWWFGRYFFPLFLLMTLASGPILDRLGQGVALFRSLKPAHFTAVALALHLALFAAQVPEQFLRHKPNLNVSGFLRAARALDRFLPPESRAGAFQSGTMGYFSRRAVINLDGVVNSEAARALREKTMADYVRQEEIEAVVDYPGILEALLVRRSSPGAAKRLGPVQPLGPFLLILVNGTAPSSAEAQFHR